MILNGFASSYFLIRYINPKYIVQMLLLRLIRIKGNIKDSLVKSSAFGPLHWKDWEARNLTRITFLSFL